MNNTVFSYLLSSFKIIFSYPKILIVYAVVSFLYFWDYIKFETEKSILYSISMVAYLFIYPIIYGKYTEIITNEKHNSYWDIFKNHWLDYYLVCIILSLPAILFLFFSIVLNLPNVPASLNLIVILINVLAIYVIPLVFITQKRLHSVFFGLKCIIGNFNHSWLLVALTIISSILNLFFREHGLTIFNGNLLITALIGSILSFVLIIVDFVVFISASLILKEKLS